MLSLRLPIDQVGDVLFEFLFKGEKLLLLHTLFLSLLHCVELGLYLADPLVKSWLLGVRTANNRGVKAEFFSVCFLRLVISVQAIFPFPETFLKFVELILDCVDRLV